MNTPKAIDKLPVRIVEVLDIQALIDQCGVGVWHTAMLTESNRVCIALWIKRNKLPLKFTYRQLSAKYVATHKDPVPYAFAFIAAD